MWRRRSEWVGDVVGHNNEEVKAHSIFTCREKERLNQCLFRWAMYTMLHHVTSLLHQCYVTSVYVLCKYAAELCSCVNNCITFSSWQTCRGWSQQCYHLPGCGHAPVSAQTRLLLPLLPALWHQVNDTCILHCHDSCALCSGHTSKLAAILQWKFQCDLFSSCYICACIDIYRLVGFVCWLLWVCLTPALLVAPVMPCNWCNTCNSVS